MPFVLRQLFPHVFASRLPPLRVDVVRRLPAPRSRGGGGNVRSLTVSTSLPPSSSIRRFGGCLLLEASTFRLFEFVSTSARLPPVLVVVWRRLLPIVAVPRRRVETNVAHPLLPLLGICAAATSSALFPCGGIFLSSFSCCEFFFLFSFVRLLPLPVYAVTLHPIPASRLFNDPYVFAAALCLEAEVTFR